jgi:hypothetical protein
MSKIICYILGHKYRLHKKITDEIREVKCIRCNMLFSMSDNPQCLLPMDDELHELHKILSK